MFFQSSEALGEKALAPHGDDLTARVQTSGNSVVAHAFGSVEDHLGSLYLKIRQRILAGPSAQLGFLGRREGDIVWA
jgi:hypothetical protein